jgi:hypothetical protein
MTIYIDQETGKRVNIYAPYKGRSKLNTPEIRAAVGVIEIEDDPKPADFTYDDYEVKEDWETNQRPYTIYAKKSSEQLAEIRWNKLKQKRDAMLTGEAGCKVEIEPGVFKWFHTDVYSKTQQLGLENEAIKIMIQGGDMSTLLVPTPWKTMDKTTVPMTAAVALKVATAQKMRDGILHAIADAKRRDDTPIEEGWPQTYADTLVEEIPDES